MLEIRNLHATVEGREILKGIDLTVRAGEVHAIMGPNGSGKSTLSHVLAGREGYTVTAGSVTFNGKSLLDLEPEERAGEGVFLAFQYPIEIPGVNNVYMLKAARRMRGDIAARVEAAVARPGAGAWIGVFAFVLVMIVREGMETALILSTLMFEQGSRNLLAGAALGVLLAAALAWAWSRFGQRVNLRRFFQVTSLFLVLFTVQLLIYAFHEFTEAGAIPGIDNAYWHVATEPYGPEGVYGEWLTYLMVLVPAAWLALAWWQDRHAPTAAGAQAT